MDNDQRELKKFLEEQVEWCKRQDGILGEIEKKLYEMKEIAEQIRRQETTSLEVYQLNVRFTHLKQEVQSLEQQLQTDFH